MSKNKLRTKIVRVGRVVVEYLVIDLPDGEQRLVPLRWGLDE
jgi:hypothetical protein